MGWRRVRARPRGLAKDGEQVVWLTAPMSWLGLVTLEVLSDLDVSMIP